MPGKEVPAEDSVFLQGRAEQGLEPQIPFPGKPKSTGHGDTELGVTDTGILRTGLRGKKKNRMGKEVESKDLVESDSGDGIWGPQDGYGVDMGDENSTVGLVGGVLLSGLGPGHN